MSGALLPCSGCLRHVRVGEPRCPFCGMALAPRVAITELRLLTPLDRGRRVALGAVLSAAGIALGCREPAVAIYGAPPTPPEAASAASSAPPVPVEEPRPSPQPSSPRTVEPPAPAPTASVVAPTPQPPPTLTTVKPTPPPRERPDPRLAPAYGGPPTFQTPVLPKE